MKYNSIISTQVKDENDYLDEWIDYHLGIGFDHIVIYDNESKVPVKKRKHTTVIPEHRIFEGSAEDNCHNDTVRNFESNWIARIDIDEFIVLKQHNNINDLLEPYKDYGGLGINWRVFGTSGHVEKTEGLVKDNYVWRMPDNCGWILNGGSFHLKTIIRREFCVQVHHPHFCLSTRPLVNEDFQPYPDAWTDSSRKLAVINHYITKSVKEYQAKYDLWRHRFEYRTMNELADIDKNCIVYDDTLKTNDMNNEKNWQWASHQPLIKGILDLYKPEFVLELGIGENSSLLFAGMNYLGVENDSQWIEHMSKKSRQKFVWHNLDRQAGTLQDYYSALEIPKTKNNLLFVDNYESCRMIAINTLRDKFNVIIFHDCEPSLGARVNHYEMINSEGFVVYFLKTSANWTGIMIRNDLGYDNLKKAVDLHIANFKKLHPEVSCMYMDNQYEGFAC